MGAFFAAATMASSCALSSPVVPMTRAWPLAAASWACRTLAAASGKALVIGTTGLDKAQLDAIVAAAKKAPILTAPNMSVGVNLLLRLVKEAAARLGEDYDIEIFEMHHRHKVDAPSGTALALGGAAAQHGEADVAGLTCAGDAVARALAFLRQVDAAARRGID